MQNQQNEYKVGDLVWAKMKNCTVWPARIEDPTTAQKKSSKNRGVRWVKFFGSHDHAWIEEENLKPYRIHRNLFSTTIKIPNYKKAHEEIEEELKKQNIDEYNIDEELNNSADQENEKMSNDVEKEKNENSSPTAKKPRKKRSMNSENKIASAKRPRKSVVDENRSPAYAPKINNVAEILNRPSILDTPEEPTVDLNHMSSELQSRDIQASNLRFGFLGLGIMGSGMVRNLILSGHKVNVWSRSLEKADNVKAKADAHCPGKVNTCLTVSDVVDNSDVIFVCVSDPAAVEDIVTGKYGFIYERTSLSGKGYVEMTSVDTESSTKICQFITGCGGRYLEAQLQGSKKEANDGNLFILAAGDKSLYDDCASCFKAMAKAIYYLGEVGFASKMNLVLQIMKGVALLGVAEGLALADRSGIPLRDVVEVFNLTNFCSPYLKSKADLIVSMAFERVEQPLQHMQKDMRLALQLADTLKQPLFMVSTANEIYKHARRLGYDTYDAASVYVRSRH